MELARERGLIHNSEFFALKLAASKLPGDGVIAHRQVLRLWRKGSEGLELPEVTMTVLAARLYDGKRHEEWDVTGFLHEPEARMKKKKTPFRKPEETDTVIMKRLRKLQEPQEESQERWGDLTIRLESVEGKIRSSKLSNCGPFLTYWIRLLAG